MRSKPHLFPPSPQRAVPASSTIAPPTWEGAPVFDLHRHVRRVKLDRPGTDVQLMETSAKLFEGMLDRNKPLWEMYQVEGLEGNRTALVSKVHHCLVDGVSGIELLMIVLDVSSNPAPPPPVVIDARPPIPAAPTRFIDAIFDNMTERLDRLSDLQKSTVDSMLTGESRTRTALRSLEATQPDMADAV